MHNLEWLKEKIKEKFNDEYSINDGEKFITMKTKMTFLHKNCNNFFMATPENLLQGYGCPRCGRKKAAKSRTLTTEQFKQIVKSKDPSYEVIGDYVKSKEKIRMRHLDCGKEYSVTPNSFISGHRCPFCFGSPLKTQRQFEEEVNLLTNGEYKVEGKYRGSNKKILMKHLKCGHTYEITPIHFLNKNRCPICNISSGEERIRQILEKNNINYEMQVVFPDLQNRRFDFFIENNFLIEYDGEFHYFNKWDEEKLFRQKQYDKEKSDFCMANNIKLIRIPFWYSNKLLEIVQGIIDTKDNLSNFPIMYIGEVNESIEFLDSFLIE